MRYVVKLVLVFLIGCGGIEYSKGNSGDDKSVNTDNSDNSDNSVVIGDVDDPAMPVDPDDDTNDCSQQENGPDGPGGFEWNPEDQVTIKFPGVYSGFGSVGAWTMIGGFDEAEFLQFDSKGRQVWRLPDNGDHYTGKIVVDTNEYGECIWLVPHPSETND